MTDIKRSERVTINRAWDAILYAAQQDGTGSEARLKRALAYERRGRSAEIYAKACMARAVSDGMRDTFGEADAWTYSEGLAQAYLFGRYICRSSRPEDLPELERIATLCKDASAALSDATNRRLAAIR